MKRKITMKEIRENYSNIIQVGYCELQNLLRGQEPKYYTCGIYGWNADIYEIDNKTVIVTGYRPFGNIKTNYEINNKYDEKSYKTWKLFGNYEDNSKKNSKILNNYIKELLNK